MDIEFICKNCGNDLVLFTENLNEVISPPTDVIVEIVCGSCGECQELKIAIDLMSESTAELSPKLPFLKHFGKKRQCVEV